MIWTPRPAPNLGSRGRAARPLMRPSNSELKRRARKVPDNVILFPAYLRTRHGFLHGCRRFLYWDEMLDSLSEMDRARTRRWAQRPILRDETGKMVRFYEGPSAA